jgi:hypothetical protein
MDDRGLQDGLLAYYLAQVGASDVNVERRLEREPFDYRSLVRGDGDRAAREAHRGVGVLDQAGELPPVNHDVPGSYGARATLGILGDYPGRFAFERSEGSATGEGRRAKP